MAEVSVVTVDEQTYRVTVIEDGSTSTHEVTVQPEDLARFGSGAPGEELVEASFRFLLDREPKESILSRFDLAIIGRYFPEYQRAIGDYL